MSTTTSVGIQGRYEFGRLLGAGAMAKVYAGTVIGAEGFRMPVAIKRVHPDGDDAAARESMIRGLIGEAKLGSQLNHPNIVRILQFERDGPDLIVVMELVDGLSVRAMINWFSAHQQRLPMGVIADLMVQAADGLHAAHSAIGHGGDRLNVVHRDVKPENLMMTWSGQVKVMDFGIARSDCIESRTAADTTKGTPSYMSPEQAMGRALTGRSDLFALGAVLYELVVGKPLFAAGNLTAILYKVVEFNPKDAAAEIAAIYPQLGPIFAAMMQNAAADRLESAEKLAKLLNPHATRRALGEWLEARQESLKAWSTEGGGSVAVGTESFPPGNGALKPGSLDPWSGIVADFEEVPSAQIGSIVDAGVGENAKLTRQFKPKEAGRRRKVQTKRRFPALLVAGLGLPLLVGFGLLVMVLLRGTTATETTAVPALLAAVLEEVELPTADPIDLDLVSDTAPMVAVRAPVQRRPTPEQRREPTPARVVETTPTPEPVVMGTGTVTLNAFPASVVTVDRKRLGSTPKFDVELPAGSHTVVFTCEDTEACESGWTCTTTFDLPVGGSHAIKFGWAGGAWCGK